MNFAKTYVGIFNKILPDAFFADGNFDPESMERYYGKMGKYYIKYHSDEGAMHSSIKTNELERHKDRLLYQANSIAKLIKEHKYLKVVELGCGFGMNSIFLARLFPDVEFVATDLNDFNLEKAEKNATGISNLKFFKLNFNDDHAFRQLKADLVFGIETLCYAPDIGVLLKNISSVLSPNGRIVIFDCYETNDPNHSSLSADEKKAYKLLCWGWMLNKFQAIQDLYDAAPNNQLVVEGDYDLTQNVISNYKVLQKTSEKIFGYPLLVKTCLRLKILNHFVFMHIVSGLFGAYFLESKFIRHLHVILLKEDQKMTAPNVL